MFHVRPSPEAIQNVVQKGPSKIVINASGEAKAAFRAWTEHGVLPDIAFLRNDGWSLGDPHRLEGVAFQLWPDDWDGFVLREERIYHPISEYSLNRINPPNN